MAKRKYDKFHDSNGLAEIKSTHPVPAPQPLADKPAQAASHTQLQKTSIFPDDMLASSLHGMQQAINKLSLSLGHLIPDSIHSPSTQEQEAEWQHCLPALSGLMQQLLERQATRAWPAGNASALLRHSSCAWAPKKVRQYEQMKLLHQVLRNVSDLLSSNTSLSSKSSSGLGNRPSQTPEQPASAGLQSAFIDWGRAGMPAAKAVHVLKADIFTRPQAVLAVQMAGKPFDLRSMAGGRTSRQEALTESTSALELSASLQAVSAAAQSGLDVYRADYATLPGCSDACMEALLQEALLAIGGNYTVGVGGPMRGVARVWQAEGAGGPAVELDLQQLPIRLWAAEIAVLRHTASEMATEKIRREAQSAQSVGSSWLLEATMVGLQAVSQGDKSSLAEYAGAELAVQASIRQAHNILSRAFTDRVATQVVMLAEVPTFVRGLQGLLQWRAVSLRNPSASLSSSLGGTLPSGGRDSLNWQTDSSAWLSFIVIVVFLAAGILCLTNMQFKKDSLLYGRAKAD
ncbi:hypothetical protein WJX84_012419 [Apatococcus fuscideae]|uniref:DUF7794 domain-containing protein n=1 Tax=Apatococcus fuscideae TaxID=2026836 RepID=A0AAW1SSE9_9CHLO